METIEWPERPTCHDANWQARHFGETTWRPKNVKLHPSHDTPMAYGTCSYCGSMHPEDLLAAIEAGATLSVADWKYGWPHKFYVDNIPNPNIGQMVSRSSGSGFWGTAERGAMTAQYESRPGVTVKWTQDGKRWAYKVYEPDSATTNGKWYNEHLADLDPEAFAAVAAVLEKKTGIRFERDEGGLRYCAVPMVRQ